MAVTTMKCASLVLFALLVALPASGQKLHSHHHKRHHRHHHGKHLRAHTKPALDEVNLGDVNQQETKATANEIEQLVDIKPEDIDAQIAQLTREDSQIDIAASLPTLADEQTAPKAQIAATSLPTLADEQITPKEKTAQKSDAQVDTLSQLAQEGGEPKIEDQLQQVASVETDTEASFHKAFGDEDADMQALARQAPLLPAQSDDQLVSLGNLDSLVDTAAVEATPSVDEAAAKAQAAYASKIDAIVKLTMQNKKEVHPKTQSAPAAQVTEEKSQHVPSIGEQDAKKIDGYIQTNSQEQLQKQLKSMAKQGGTARIHGAVRALMKMGYTAKAVSEWVAGKDPEAGLSTDVRQKGATPALDAKLMYMALKKSEQSELRKVVNTMFRYGGAARVQRAKGILAMWLRSEQAPQPGTKKESSPLEREVFAELSSVKQQLAESDATEIAGHLQNNDLAGLRAFIRKMRSDGGEQRVLAASHEVQRHVQTADVSHAPDALSELPMVAAQISEKHEDAQKAKAPPAQVPVQALAKASTPAEKASSPPAKASTPADRNGRGRVQPKKVDAALLALQEKQQAQIDAAILAKYLKIQDHKGLKAAYNDMRKHGGWQRVDKAESLAKSMM